MKRWPTTRPITPGDALQTKAWDAVDALLNQIGAGLAGTRAVKAVTGWTDAEYGQWYQGTVEPLDREAFEAAVVLALESA